MNSLTTAESLLRERRLRVTPQRQGVLGLFLENPGQHWTADQIRSQLLGRMPGLARGTTYKVLDELVAADLAEEIPTGTGGALYGLRLVPHHHFLCRVCGRWFDVEARGLDTVIMVDGPSGASVDEMRVLFRGICATCAVANPGDVPPSR